ncbi:B116 [miniopterid betaherpesvirus 1]|uniref:B116 n=1 Tax=miniopterid betaherpesvirus 1 TaxID=3070189 RepID=I3VQA6_9BETA|nr:B116 [miniopterid betaherpesvirus 1]AFK83950.1 B116 [miniopterid betaherpesvirus 1]
MAVCYRTRIITSHLGSLLIACTVLAGSNIAFANTTASSVSEPRSTRNDALPSSSVSQTATTDLRVNTTVYDSPGSTSAAVSDTVSPETIVSTVTESSMSATTGTQAPDILSSKTTNPTEPQTTSEDATANHTESVTVKSNPENVTVIASDGSETNITEPTRVTSNFGREQTARETRTRVDDTNASVFDKVRSTMESVNETELCAANGTLTGFSLIVMDNITLTLTACDSNGVAIFSNVTTSVMTNRGVVAVVISTIYKRLSLSEMLPRLTKELERYRYTLKDFV